MPNHMHLAYKQPFKRCARTKYVFQQQAPGVCLVLSWSLFSYKQVRIKIELVFLLDQGAKQVQNNSNNTVHNVNNNTANMKTW